MWRPQNARNGPSMSYHAPQLGKPRRGLYRTELLEALRHGAECVAGEWGLSPETRVSLLDISENATFLAEDPERETPVVLRVHRPGCRERDEIRSELAWIEELLARGTVWAPRPLPLLRGGRVTRISVDGAARHVVAFEFMPGREPLPSARLAPQFERLGAISARLHLHAQGWARPRWFARKAWNHANSVGDTPIWGDWRAAPGLMPEGAAILERLCEALRLRLAEYGAGPDRFGLIHADLRLTNLLEDGDALGVIDCDDCGFGWFAYDFAASVSFMEHEPWIPELQAAWLEGYRTEAPPPPGAEQVMPALILLRRLLLTAWIGSHPETPTALELGAGYAAGTVEMAERFLVTDGCAGSAR